MSRLIVIVVAIACLQAAAKPVRRTLNFNMFVLQPRQGSTDRLLLSTNGVSRFGPLLEYLVQRVQGMMSVYQPPEAQSSADMPVTLRVGDEALPDASENEVDAQVPKTPGIVVRPSQTKPGTYEVEINVVVDDGQPDVKKSS